MTSSEPAEPRQPGGPPARAVGLRERKKQKTREAIQRAALRLFLKQGYEETTIEQIAAAVEISPSTFFNYFPTKEEVVMMDAYDPLTVAMFLERPKHEALSVSIRRVLEALAGILERDRELILTRGRLMWSVPALRARIWDEMERTQDFFVPLLAERTGRDPDDFDLRVTARIVVGAVYEASLQWMKRDGRDDLVELVNRALDVVDAAARLDALSRPRPRARHPSR